MKFGLLVAVLAGALHVTTVQASISLNCTGGHTMDDKVLNSNFHGDLGDNLQLTYSLDVDGTLSTGVFTQVEYGNRTDELSDGMTIIGAEKAGDGSLSRSVWITFVGIHSFAQPGTYPSGQGSVMTEIGSEKVEIHGFSCTATVSPSAAL